MHVVVPREQPHHPCTRWHDHEEHDNATFDAEGHDSGSGLLRNGNLYRKGG